MVDMNTQVHSAIHGTNSIGKVFNLSIVSGSHDSVNQAQVLVGWSVIASLRETLLCLLLIACWWLFDACR